MLPTMLSVFLDYRCNFSCAHCSVGSSPSTRMKMPESIFRKLFDDLEQVESFRVIVFTGGEATLHPEMLKEGIRRGKALGLRTRIVSNAWWAKSVERSKAYLQDLVDHGLDEINTSYDDFHEPFIKIEKIGNLLEATMELGMTLGLGVINDRDAKYNTASIKQYLCDRLGMPWSEMRKHLVLVDDYPTPSGTGESLDVGGLSAGTKLDIGCPEIMKTISVHPNGSVKACCGHGQLYQKDLAIGNIAQESMKDILERSTENIFYWWLHYVGPANILKRLGVNRDYASICHACNDLLGPHREELVAYLKAHKDEIFQQEVLVSDHIVRMAEWIAGQEEVIVSRLADEML